MNRMYPVFLVVCLLTVFAALPGSAQVSTSAVAGTISDTTGAVVPGAQITLTFPATGQARQTQSSANGEYVFS